MLTLPRQKLGRRCWDKGAHLGQLLLVLNWSGEDQHGHGVSPIAGRDLPILKYKLQEKVQGPCLN